MLGIVVSGHLNFASGMQSAVQAIVGKQDQLEFVDFLESMSTEQLEEKLVEAMKNVNTGEGVLFLTDIYGGSPTNRAINILLQNPDVEVVCGANLSMIVNAALEREEFTLKELKDALVSGEMSNIKDIRTEVETAMNAQDEESEDGL
ncbi:PTS sugar transporter subunit IIA [Pasteurellaceae bacterium HPA106]|uniref:PTS galactosamine/N-acetylgalactosamine transporter subunit IIA n=1 Tax=Spirabiliibacterium pneumoniae TaxID=221400 RepID=UPI001AACA2A1|nr:PTS galactosamine/N-acetylgalactosamine transporter subunit IIA [Spirabiliibacterium pneumoniae]MBE2895307.1 PTS sugar transporter subunit IIA [Spirabiliibacterium pneumoniae]